MLLIATRRKEHEGRKPKSTPAMAQLIIEPKKGKEGQVEYTVNYHDKKSDNSFTITVTNDLNEAVEKLKATLESEVAAMQQKK